MNVLEPNDVLCWALKGHVKEGSDIGDPNFGASALTASTDCGNFRVLSSANILQNSNVVYKEFLKYTV
jgi:hypothetical protein